MILLSSHLTDNIQYHKYFGGLPFEKNTDLESSRLLIAFHQEEMVLFFFCEKKNSKTWSGGLTWSISDLRDEFCQRSNTGVSVLSYFWHRWADWLMSPVDKYLIWNAHLNTSLSWWLAEARLPGLGFDPYTVIALMLCRVFPDLPFGYLRQAWAN